ncbi:hypothetical protein LCGC14_0680390 [marine sediment metagenome]|uniref:Uncharacterized protein n=1 Tax=marine sediment metagenome TaxID=412755 RepID=A0A0F9T9S7_9ZZZZ
MAVKTKTGYKCFYCEKSFTHPEKADVCRDSHDLVYIPMSREDLNKLRNFIMIPDEKILRGPRGKPIPAVRLIFNMIKGNRSLK